MKVAEQGLADLRRELERLAASQFKIELDHKFEPETGALLKVRHGGAEWHMIPQDFRNLLAGLPAGCGPEAVQRAIEKKVSPLWHGPAPEDSRDAQP